MSWRHLDNTCYQVGRNPNHFCFSISGTCHCHASILLVICTAVHQMFTCMGTALFESFFTCIFELKELCAKQCALSFSIFISMSLCPSLTFQDCFNPCRPFMVRDLHLTFVESIGLRQITKFYLRIQYKRANLFLWCSCEIKGRCRMI
jgi:hypothetical protein